MSAKKERRQISQQTIAIQQKTISHNQAGPAIACTQYPPPPTSSTSESPPPAAELHSSSNNSFTPPPPHTIRQNLANPSIQHF